MHGMSFMNKSIVASTPYHAVIKPIHFRLFTVSHHPRVDYFPRTASLNNVCNS